METRLIEAFFKSAEFKNFDGLRIWELLKDVTCTWMERPLEFRTYASLGESEFPAAPQILGTPEDGGNCSFTILLDVHTAGLTALLDAQLGYVPRYAVIELFVLPQGIVARQVMVCLGHTGFVEPFAAMQQILTTIDGMPVMSDVAQIFVDTPEITKVWCLGTVTALRKRGMLLEKAKAHNSVKIQLMPVGAYGLQ